MNAKRYVIRHTDDGWYIFDTHRQHYVEGYGSDKAHCYRSACFHNYQWRTYGRSA